MEDFLGNELKIGDEVVINQNTMTGSSTHRKILKRAIVERFTKMQVVTNKGYINPDNVIKVIKIINDYKPASCEKDQQIADLEAKLAESEKAYIDLKELEQATTESLYASREYLDKVTSEKWALEKQFAESESELEKQKEKYDKLYGCYKKTSSEDLKVKYRLAEENEQLKQQLLAEKEQVCDELAMCLIANFDQDAEFTVEEIVKWLQKYKDQIRGRKCKD